MSVTELIRVEELTEPVPAGDAGPCGPDLADDLDHVGFMQLAQGKGDQAGEAGDEWADPAAETERWRNVLRQGTRLLARTKDVWVAVYVCFAGVRLGGLSGLCQGLSLVDTTLARYWDEVHPRHDPEDEYPVQRVNAVAELGGGRFLRMVRWCRLVQSGKYGACTVRDVLVAAGELQPATPTTNEDGTTNGSAADPADRIVADVAANDPAALAAAAADVRRAIGLLAQISARQVERIGSGNAADLSALRRLLDVVDRYLTAARPAAVAASDLAAGDGNGGGGERTAAVGPSAAGAGATSPSAVRIQSRADVTVLLDRICQFYRETEPTSPVPLLLVRASRLVSMTSFFDVIRDLSPGALDEVRRISGRNPDGGDDDAG